MKKNSRISQGSSPRMRGTRGYQDGARTEAGLIPTYAGNTHNVDNVLSVLWAHPHVCGEHLPSPSASLDDWGSSPRMRGTRCTTFWDLAGVGLIPTYAGNTHCGIGAESVMWAHPHVCGEHSSILRSTGPSVGSSPRMRGTQQPCHTRPVRTGLIPTYAGNTCPTLEPPGCLRAHPHVCGEHTTLMEVSRAPKGSSPRMRGTPLILLNSQP